MSEGKAVLIRHLTLRHEFMTRGVRQRKSFYHTAAIVHRKQQCEIVAHWRNECVIAMVALRRILLGVLWPLQFSVLCTEAGDCQWDLWTSWGPCDKTCGDGQYRRTRVIAVHASNGGADCTRHRTQYRRCNNGPCPGISSVLA